MLEDSGAGEGPGVLPEPTSTDLSPNLSLGALGAPHTEVGSEGGRPEEQG